MPDPIEDFAVKLGAVSSTFAKGTNLHKGEIRPKTSAYPHCFVDVSPIDVEHYLDSTSQGSALVEFSVVSDVRKSGEGRVAAQSVCDDMRRVSMISDGYWEAKLLSPVPEFVLQDDADRTIYVVNLRASWIVAD